MSHALTIWKWRTVIIVLCFSSDCENVMMTNIRQFSGLLSEELNYYLYKHVKSITYLLVKLTDVM